MTYKFFIFSPGDLYYTELHPNYSQCSIEKVRETPFIIRTKFNGKLKFYGDDYNTLKQHVAFFKVPITIVEIDKNLNEKQYNGQLMLRGEWNEFQKYCLLDSVVQDEYADFFEDPENNIETEYNLIDIADRYTVFCDKDPNIVVDFYYEVKTAGYPVIKNPSTNEQYKIWHQFNAADFIFYYFNIYARQRRLFKKINNEIFIPSGGWKYYTAFDYGDSYDLVRTWDYYYKAPTNCKDDYPNPIDKTSWENMPDVDSSGNNIDSIVGNFDSLDNTNYFDKFYNIFSYFAGNMSYAVTYKYLNPPTRIYNRNRKLTDIISAFVNKIDSSIFFANAFSFKVFDENTELNNLLISGIYDITHEDTVRMIEIQNLLVNPSTSADQLKSLNDEYTSMEPRAIANVSLKTIFDWLAQQFHIYWWLYYLDGNWYFRLSHVSDLNFATLGIDLTNYKGKNWIGDKSFTYSDEMIYSAVKRNSDSDIYEFKGLDIIYPNIPLLKKQQINFNNIYTDIWTLQNRKSKLDSGVFVWTADEYVSPNFVEKFENYNSHIYETLEYGIQANTLHFINSTGQAMARSNIIGDILKGDHIYVKYNIISSTVTPDPILYIGNDTNSSIVSIYNPYDSEVIPNEDIYGARFFINSNLGEATIEITIGINGYKCRIAAGKITTQPIANVELSIANSDDKYIAETSLSEGLVNNTNKTGMLKIRDKMQSDVKLPTAELFDNYDFTKYITSNFGDCAIEKITRPLNGDFDKLEISKIK